ncbi:hypothetical protein T265_00692 [Opisthorchis viverrini]|uniref:Uncharacterized protein n=1 Tax=Opisthorchis viverrini TaxID=6198 RepID=A0A075ABX8_OPIVI|nr:hypothetical protein T265_00692 [Opisthorchis viverrini]KER33370.1 hypothetical protein T265_00692 [Opisthorchis viverrini]
MLGGVCVPAVLTQAKLRRRNAGNITTTQPIQLHTDDVSSYGDETFASQLPSHLINNQ